MELFAIFLLILVAAAVIGGLVLARVFAEATRCNPERSGAEEDRESTTQPRPSVRRCAKDPARDEGRR